jgi:hypothetical protein
LSVVLHPALQFYQLALQAEQLLEIQPPVDRFPGGVARELAGQFVEAIVVDLKFEFFVETVLPFGSDKVVKRMLGADGSFGHLGAPDRDMRSPAACSNADVSGVTRCPGVARTATTNSTSGQ